jgi:putative oxidoreductase
MDFLEKLKPLSLLLLRCALGIVFISHGYPKLFTQTANWLQAFPRMGFPSYFAYIAGVLEFFGGCLLIAGLFTRVVSLLLAIEMGIALAKVHLPQGIYVARNYEFPLMLCVAAFTLATVGAGMISLDYPIFRGKARVKSKT